MEFKKLEIKEEGNFLQRNLKKPHVKRTLIYMLIGGVLGFLYFYIAEGQHMDAVPSGEILQSIGFGAFLGFFLTNSPCARGKC